MKQDSSERPTFFFVTAPMPCPYVLGKVERRIVAELGGRNAPALHDALSRVGFRRSHGLVYAPACPGCVACLAVRTVAADFEMSASQRRVAKMNCDLDVRETTARATSEQFEVFSAYQDSRHAGGDMATMDFYDFQSLVEETPVESTVVEFRSGGKLVAGCLVDRMSDGLSAVYSYFDPAQKRRSLGTYIILWLIERARELGLSYVYLGYWIGESSKMSYKEKFRPLEVYSPAGWAPFGFAEEGAGACVPENIDA